MIYKNILLIDDDEDEHEIFVTALQAISDKVNFIAMNNAQEALAKLLSQAIEADVIFLDLNMPVMTGQQFLVEIKKRESLKNIPVIIFSTSAHFATIELTKELGAADFITKPDKFDDLLMTLKSILPGSCIGIS